MIDQPLRFNRGGERTVQGFVSEKTKVCYYDYNEYLQHENDPVGLQLLVGTSSLVRFEYWKVELLASIATYFAIDIVIDSTNRQKDLKSRN